MAACPAYVLLTSALFFFGHESLLNLKTAADGTPYPIVPSFKDWPFPHGAVPDSWKLPENHNPGVDRTRCIVTNRSAGLKKAHIVHREDGDWFRGRGMALYTIGPQGIDSSENLVNLRADLHNVYDAQDFVFVPKREIYGADADVDNTPAYVLHVLGADVHDIWAEFHNVRVQGIRHTMAEFHFVRFARSILLSVKQFIIQGYPRTVIRAREGGEGVATRLTGPGLERHYSGGGGENATCQSPRKRQRGEGVVDEMAEEGPQSSDTEGGSDYEGEESGARTPSGVAGTTTTKRGRSPSLPFEAGEWEPALEA